MSIVSQIRRQHWTRFSDYAPEPGTYLVRAHTEPDKIIGLVRITRGPRGGYRRPRWVGCPCDREIAPYQETDWEWMCVEREECG